MKLKKKVFSGYQSPLGSTYVDDVSSIIDDTDRVLDWSEKTPIVKKTSKRWRNRVRGYTKPLKKIVERKKSTTN